MSERYQFMITWARDKILPQLDRLGLPDLDKFMAIGWDALPESYQYMMKRIFETALVEQNYELSYNQTCNALNQAFKIKGWVP